MRSALLIRCACTLLSASIASWALTTSVGAQRVQFPTNVPGGAYPFTPQPTLSPSVPSTFSPGYDPYANPALGPPPLDVPYAAPPVAQPFGSPAPLGSPMPYGGAPPLGSTPAYGAAPPLASNGAPLIQPNFQPAMQQAAPASGGLMQNWNWPGAGTQRGTYDHQNPDGTMVRVQRLLQQLSAEHTWLYGDGSARDLEINRTELAASFGVPIFANPDTPLLITPGFAFNWWEGPQGPPADLPPRTYDAYLDAAWRPQLTDWLAADLGVRTGVWTDFEVVNDDSIRILGRGLGVVKLSPRLEVLAGVWYLDRNHIKLLPAGGVHWRPSADFDAYLVFPNPKVRSRFVNLGTSQWWWYAGGEYGGGRWTIERADGREDDFDYNDIRIFGGLEWLTKTQARGHVEAGLAFDRELRYAQTQDPSRLSLDETVMVRAGIDF